MKRREFVKQKTKGQIRKNRWIDKLVFKDEPNKFTFLDDDGWIIKKHDKVKENRNNPANLDAHNSEIENLSNLNSTKIKTLNSNDENSKDQQISLFLDESFNDVFNPIIDNDDFVDLFDEFSNFEFNCF